MFFSSKESFETFKIAFPGNMHFPMGLLLKQSNPYVTFPYLYSQLSENSSAICFLIVSTFIALVLSDGDISVTLSLAKSTAIIALEILLLKSGILHLSIFLCVFLQGQCGNQNTVKIQ